MPPHPLGFVSAHQVRLASRGQEGLGVGRGEVAGRQHQFRDLDLPDGLHLTQDVEGHRIDRPILQHLDHFRRDALEQAAPALDRLDVDIEGAGKFVLRDAPLERAHDHVMLLDGGQAVDALVVGEGLVVGGDEAPGGRLPEVA
jgi:hypothetical protein